MLVEVHIVTVWVKFGAFLSMIGIMYTCASMWKWMLKLNAYLHIQRNTCSNWMQYIQDSSLLFCIFESSMLGLILHPYTLLIITNSKQGRQRTYKRNVGARSRYHYCRGKALSITYSECVSVSLVIQHTKRMRLIVLLSVSCTAVPYFSHYLINRTTFQGGGDVLQHKTCVLIFSATVVRNISHSKRKWARYYHKCMLVVM